MARKRNEMFDLFGAERNKGKEKITNPAKMMMVAGFSEKQAKRKAKRQQKHKGHRMLR